MANLLELLKMNLKKGIVSFVYMKKDGTERKATGTLYGIGHTISGTGEWHSHKTTMRYYDVDKRAWRSFIVKNLLSVGEVRHGSKAECEDICLALVVKLKEKMKTDGKCAFAYQDKSGKINYVHGTYIEDEDVENGTFTYFDTDKGCICEFNIANFISIGEREEIEETIENDGIFLYDYEEEKDYRTGRMDYSTSHKETRYNDFSESGKIKSILKANGIDTDDVEQYAVIDLLPYLNKEQLKDLIIKATTRLAEL